MQQTRLHIAGSYGCDSELDLDADKAHYLSRVLRLKNGDGLAVFDGAGNEFAASIIALSRESVTLRILDRISSTTESGLRVHLVQGISRGDRMDFVVQKATELGVERITPVTTEHGVIKLDPARAAKRRDHWQKVAAAACEQSGRVRLPLIDSPVALKSWFADKPPQVDAELILKPGSPTSLAAIDSPQTKVCVLIGPEGGFSNSEYDDADLMGFRAVSVGPRVLRTETAAIVTLAVMQSRWGDLR